jgi:hypothetical protein
MNVEIGTKEGYAMFFSSNCELKTNIAPDTSLAITAQV